MSNRPNGIRIHGAIIAAATTLAFLAIVLVAILRPAELAEYTVAISSIATLALAVMTVEANRTASKSLGVANDSVDVARASLAELKREREAMLSPYVDAGYESMGGTSLHRYEVGIENVGGDVARSVRVVSNGEVSWLKFGQDRTVVAIETMGVKQRLPLVGIVPTLSADLATKYPAVEVQIIWLNADGREVSYEAWLDPVAYIGRQLA